MIAAVILYRAIAMTVDLALILLALAAVSYLIHLALRAALKLRTRRKDREWFAWIASEPRGSELLAWLRAQRAAVRRHGRVRPVPRADDTELDEREREEWERMKTFYADDGMDPHSKRQPRRSS